MLPILGFGIVENSRDPRILGFGILGLQSLTLLCSVCLDNRGLQKGGLHPQAIGCWAAVWHAAKIKSSLCVAGHFLVGRLCMPYCEMFFLFAATSKKISWKWQLIGMS